MRNLVIVLNERAGSLLDRDPLAVKAELRRRLAGPGRTVEVLLAHGRSIGRAIDRGAASDYDTIIVGGGDGSVGHAAHRLAGTDKALGVLPLGTVNLLARDIGVPADLDDAIAAVEESVPRAIDLGMLNGRAFHTLSGMGFFSQMARAREETRDLPGKTLRVMAAAARAFRRAGRFTLDISIDGRTRHIELGRRIGYRQSFLWRGMAARTTGRRHARSAHRRKHRRAGQVEGRRRSGHRRLAGQSWNSERPGAARNRLLRDAGRGCGSAFRPCRRRPAPRLVATRAGPKRAAIWAIAP